MATNTPTPSALNTGVSADSACNSTAGTPLQKTPAFSFQIPGIEKKDLLNCSFTEAPHPSSLVEPPSLPFVVLTGGTVLGILDKPELLNYISKQPGFSMKVVQGWQQAVKDYSEDYFAGRVKFTPDPNSNAAASQSTKSSTTCTPQKSKPKFVIPEGVSPIVVPSTAPTPDLALARKRLAEQRKRLLDGRLRPAFRPPGPVLSIYDVPGRQPGALAPIAELDTVESWLSQGTQTKRVISVSSSDEDSESVTASESEATRSSDSDAFEVSPSRLSSKQAPHVHFDSRAGPAIAADVFYAATNPPFTQAPPSTPTSLATSFNNVVCHAANTANDPELVEPAAKRQFIRQLVESMERALASAVKAPSAVSLPVETKDVSESSPPFKKARIAPPLTGPTAGVQARSASAPPAQYSGSNNKMWNEPSSLFGDPNDKTLWQTPIPHTLYNAPFSSASAVNAVGSTSKRLLTPPTINSTKGKGKAKRGI